MDDREAYSIILKRLQPGKQLVWHGVLRPWRAVRSVKTLNSKNFKSQNSEGVAA